MNLDKKLTKYVKYLDNPKYYRKIIDIIDKADGICYEFKSFTQDDIDNIVDILYDYYSVFETDEKHKQMVKYCNSIWFIISDKKYILWETQSLLIALGFMFRGYLMMFIVKLTQLINPAKALDTHNIDWDMYLIHGGLKAAEFFECEIDEVEERRINLST